MTVLDLVRAGLPAALEAGAAALDDSAPTPIDSIRLLPPPEPPTVRDFAAFEEHVEDVVQSVGGSVVVPEWYEARAFYFTNPYALIGAHDDVPVPPGSHVLDFELEVATVIGRRRLTHP
jgi:2-keto-4-pentenoate hydratase/2-oxohepta-3-ene-1,7-dioic acid hydratase in catechol pathway